MTERADVERQARELVQRTTRAQGLPERVVDPAALAQVAALLTAGERERSRSVA